MRPNRTTYTPADASLTGFASNVTGATWTLTTTATSDSLAHLVTIRNDSATDHSGKTALLTGTDADGRAQTLTMALPAGSATTTSTLYFKTLTSIVPSATIGADTMDIGWAAGFVTNTIPLDVYQPGIAVAVEVSGTINYTLQHTYANIQFDTGAFTWFDHDDSSMVSATTNKDSNYMFIPQGSRVKGNSFSTGASIIYTILTQRHGE